MTTPVPGSGVVVVDWPLDPFVDGSKSRILLPTVKLVKLFMVLMFDTVHVT